MIDAGDRSTDQTPSWSAREIARRSQPDPRKPLSPVMKCAATARELALSRARRGTDAKAGDMK